MGNGNSSPLEDFDWGPTRQQNSQPESRASTVIEADKKPTQQPTILPFEQCHRNPKELPASSQAGVLRPEYPGSIRDQGVGEDIVRSKKNVRSTGSYGDRTHVRAAFSQEMPPVIAVAAKQVQPKGDSLADFTQEDIQRMITADPKRRLLIVSDNVYDATAYAKSHPGGKMVLARNNGKDVTAVFKRIHGPRAHRMLADLQIGKLKSTPDRSATSSTEAKKEITREELNEWIRADPDRLLLVLFGDVYDVTRFGGDHPGGLRVLSTHVGEECGKKFMSLHGRRAKEMVKNYYVGHLRGVSTGQSPLLCALTPAVPNSATTNPNIQSTVLLHVQTISDASHIRYFTFSCTYPLRMQPGGHIKLYNNISGERGKFYSPYECGAASFSICMKHYDKGETSSYFFSLKEGTEVFYEGPLPPLWSADNDIYLQNMSVPAAQKHVVLMAGGTGAAPLYSISRDLLVRQVANVSVVCSIQNPAGMVLGKEFRELLERHRAPQNRSSAHNAKGCYCSIIFVLTQGSPGEMVSWASRSFTGRISASMLTQASVSAAQAVVLCGPHPFNEAATRCVVDAGICTKEQVHAL